MTSIEFIIIYMLAGVFVALFVLYRAVTITKELAGVNTKAAIAFADGLDELIKRVDAQANATLGVLKILKEVAEKNTEPTPPPDK